VASSTKQFSPNERAKKQRTVDVEEKAQEDIDHMLLETLTPLLDEVEDIDILDAAILSTSPSTLETFTII
jgi:hypothetical protein